MILRCASNRIGILSCHTNVGRSHTWVGQLGVASNDLFRCLLFGVITHASETVSDITYVLLLVPYQVLHYIIKLVLVQFKSFPNCTRDGTIPLFVSYTHSHDELRSVFCFLTFALNTTTTHWNLAVRRMAGSNLQPGESSERNGGNESNS